MSRRHIFVAIAVVGMAICLLFLWLHGYSRRSDGILNNPVVAQNDESIIQVRAVPRLLSTEDEWNRFEITVPTANPPLDMHILFLVDGKGTDYITAQSLPWTQPTLLKLRLDNDDDKRIKTILKAQRLPINAKLVTYHFAYRSSGGTDEDTTLKFLHSSAGPGGIEAAGIATARIGDKIMLYRTVVYDDTSIHSSLYHPADDWHSETYAAKFPVGFAHRLSVYLQFQPHHGPPANGIVYNSKPI